MADHFSVIGFGTGSAGELAELVSKLPEQGAQSRACAAGYYYRCHSGAGSELWIHMLKEGESGKGNGRAKPANGAAQERLTVIGVTPFFSGEGRIPVRVIRIRQRPSDNAFEGAIFAELAPGQEIHQCATVALFDVVDFACMAGRKTPFLAQAQIAAFPHDLAVFDDEASLGKAQEGQKLRFAAKSFFASGLFMPGDGQADSLIFHDPEAPEFQAQSRAFLTGEVQKYELRTNPVTGQKFHWALVETLGGAMDIVANLSQVNKALKPGMIIQGEFWLCGRLIEANGKA